MTISHRFPLVSHGLSWFLCFPVELHDLLPAGLLSAAYETRFAVDLQLQVPQLWWHRRHVLPDHLPKHWQSIGKVIWMRHRACGWHAACCFCRFLQASDETQAETCDKKEQEITRRNKKKIQSRNMDGGEFESKCPWLKIAKSSFVLYLDAFDQDLRVRWWKLPDRHLGNNSAASVVILKPPRMIGPLLYLAPEFIWIKYIIF